MGGNNNYVFAPDSVGLGFSLLLWYWLGQLNQGRKIQDGLTYMSGALAGEAEIGGAWLSLSLSFISEHSALSTWPISPAR